MNDLEAQLRALDPVGDQHYEPSDFAAMVSRVVATPPPSSARLPRSFKLRFAGAVTMSGALTAGAIALLLSVGSTLPVLELGAAQPAGKVSAMGAMAIFARFEFTAGAGISGDLSSAPAYQLSSPSPSAREVTAIASAFSVTGTASDVNGDGTNWQLSSPAGDTVGYWNSGSLNFWTFSSATLANASTVTPSPTPGSVGGVVPPVTIPPTTPLGTSSGTPTTTTPPALPVTPAPPAGGDLGGGVMPSGSGGGIAPPAALNGAPGNAVLMSSHAASVPSVTLASDAVPSSATVQTVADSLINRLGFDYTLVDGSFSTTTMTDGTAMSWVDGQFTVAVDGIRTDQFVSVSVTSSGQILQANGPAFSVTSKVSYPLQSPRDGVAALNKQEAAKFASSPGPAVDPVPTTGGSTGTAPAPLAPPVVTVTLDSSSITLATYQLADGSTWLIPEFRYTGAVNGQAGNTQTWTTLAVDPAYVQLTDANKSGGMIAY